jgi:hypothetical protein
MKRKEKKEKRGSYSVPSDAEERREGETGQSRLGWGFVC